MFSCAGHRVGADVGRDDAFLLRRRGGEVLGRRFIGKTLGHPLHKGGAERGIDGDVEI